MTTATEVGAPAAEEKVPVVADQNGGAQNGQGQQEAAPAVTAAQVDEDLGKRIVRQVEHYFGDFNLMRDSFMRKTIAEAGDGGWLTVDMMLKFNRLASLSKDVDLILKSLKESGSKVVEVDEGKKSLRRLPSLPPPPEFNEDLKKELILKTVYAKGFDKKNTSLDDLIEFFGKFPNVVHINRRTYLDQKDKKRYFKVRNI